MGLIKSWIREMGDTWDGMARGEASAFMGVPKFGTGTGTPDGSVLTEHQSQMLMRFFHKQYGRYPITEFEFRQWLRDNW
jgi:hypothetical protein